MFRTTSHLSTKWHLSVNLIMFRSILSFGQQISFGHNYASTTMFRQLCFDYKYLSTHISYVNNSYNFRNPKHANSRQQHCRSNNNHAAIIGSNHQPIQIIIYVSCKHNYHLVQQSNIHLYAYHPVA